MTSSAQSLLDDGFCILPSVVPDSTLTMLRQLSEDIIAWAKHDLLDPFSRYYLRHRRDQGVLYDPYQRHPKFQSLAGLPVVLDTLEEVIGKDSFLYDDSLIYKPRGRDNAVPWHQDFISRPTEPKKFIVWIALDDVDIENGALKATPASHLNGYQSWHRVKGETHHDRIDAELVDNSKTRFLEMAAGDALIFDAMLIHGSDECHSQRPRRAYRISYQGFDQVATPRGAPIVVRGGHPRALSRRFPQAYTPKPGWQVFMNKLGKRLQRV